MTRLRERCLEAWGGRRLSKARGWSGRTIAVRLASAPLVLALVVATSDSNLVQAALFGLGAGALIAAVALALLLAYRGDGVVNFATGAVAMYAGYLYLSLSRDGRLFLPPVPNPLALVEGVAHKSGWDRLDLPDMPAFLELPAPLSPVVAMVVVVVLAALVGLVMHLLLFRHLRGSPALSKVVATVGLMLALQGIVSIRFGRDIEAVPTILPRSGVQLGDGLVIPTDQLILVLVVVVAAAFLGAIYRYSRMGVATRAAAETEKGAVLIGLSPSRLAALNWVMSTALSAAVGVLAASVIRTVDVSTMTLVVVPALAAVLVASFRSFAVAAAAGLGLGVTQAVIRFLSTASWFPRFDGVALPGLADMVPALVIIAVLVTRGERLPMRGSDVTQRLPFAPEPRRRSAGWLAFFAGLVLLSLVLPPIWRLGLNNTLIGVLLALSFVVLTGFVGQISLAQMTFAGVAAFSLAHLGAEMGLPFPVAPIVASFVGVVVGVVASVPAMRVRGVNLAIVTLALAVSGSAAVFANPSVTGGLDPVKVGAPRVGSVGFGPNDVGDFNVFGFPLDRTLPNPWFGVLIVAVVAPAFLAVRSLRKSSTGRLMLAVRSNERAAAALGISGTSTKVAAFAISSFLASLAGTLSAYSFGEIPEEQFVPMASIVLLAFAYLGGISSTGGAIFAGLLATGGIGPTLLQEVVGVSSDYLPMVGGVLMMVATVQNPEGIAGTYRLVQEWAESRFRKPSSPVDNTTMGSGSSGSSGEKLSAAYGGSR